MLYTISFQAPTFYERHGWREFGRVPCDPPGTSRVFMTKAMPEVDTSTLEWTAGSAIYGPASICGGQEVESLKILSDRRRDGGGLADLVRFSPPSGKIIKIVAVARSDEHIVGLEGGRGSKSGNQLRFPGIYGLNPKGKLHSAFISTDTISLVVYAGEPDAIKSIEIIEREPSGRNTA